MVRVTLRWLRMVCFCLWPALCAAQSPVLALTDGVGSLEVWPAITMLSDPGGRATVDEVLARPQAFQAPDSPYANLGVRRDVVWLKVPVKVESGDGEWMLNINYASLMRIDAYVVLNGGVLHHAVLGDQVPFNARVVRSRTHAMPLSLSASQRYDLLMRVESNSSLVLPISLVKPERFYAEEAGTQMIQGLLTGVGLCLIIYSLAQWVSVRDRVFIHYVFVVVGTTLFFYVHFGFAPQHLWPDVAKLNLSPGAALLAMVGGFLFTERVLDIRSIYPWLGRAMLAGSALAATVSIGFVVGFISYAAAQVTATMLGPWPLLLALPAAFTRARRGEKVALYVFVGWSVFALSTLVFVGLLRGAVPANFWTRHIFQFGAMFEMCVWMRVLGARSEEIRQLAQRVNLERDALRLLAHTDALTGLPNRRGLNDMAGVALPGSSAENMVGVYVLDLDGFKLVNDRHGHDVGDALLVAVGKRLKSVVRGSDFVARVGGDEFVIVAQGLASDTEARRLGRKLVNEFGRSFEAGGHECRVGLTIGYALAPADGREIGTLLKHADAAMYRGKQAGGHRLERAAASDAVADDAACLHARALKADGPGRP